MELAKKLRGRDEGGDMEGNEEENGGVARGKL